MFATLRRLPRNTKILSFVSLFNDLSSEAVARILPLFLRESMHVSFVAIGWVEGVAEALSILLRLGSGWISDIFNRKKPLIAVGYGISAFMRPLIPWAISLFGWSGALVMKALDRVGKAARNSPRDVMIAQDCGDNDRGAGFGLNRALDMVGGLLGIIFSIIGISLAQKNGLSDAPLSPATFQILILGASLFGFVAVALVIFGVKETVIKPAGVSPKRRAPGTWKDLPKSYYGYVACVSLFCLAGSSDAFLLLKLRSAGYTMIETLLLIMAYSFVAATSAFPIAKLSDKNHNRKTFILIGWTIYGLAYLVFAFWDSAAVLGIGFICYGLYNGFVESTEKALVADLAPATHLGRAYGLFNFSMGLMLLPANLLFGFLADQYDLKSAFLVGAVLSGIAVLGLLLLPIRGKSEIHHA
jgi:MFS family permease